MKTARYIYMGEIERFTIGPRTRAWFIRGYSLDGTAFPWIGKRQAQQEAKKLGLRAVFIESKNDY